MDEETAERLSTIVKTALDSGDLIESLGLLDFAKQQIFQLASFANLQDLKTQKAFKAITKDLLKK